MRRQGRFLCIERLFFYILLSFNGTGDRLPLHRRGTVEKNDAFLVQILLDIIGGYLYIYRSLPTLWDGRVLIAPRNEWCLKF